MASDETPWRGNESCDCAAARADRPFDWPLDEGLLAQRAIARASRITDPEHILVVATNAQRKSWGLFSSHDLVPDPNWVHPPEGGAAVALLHVVNHLLDRDRDPYLLVLPTDHQVDDEQQWIGLLRHAGDAAFDSPEQIVLIGLEPQGAPGQCWLVPGLRATDGTRPLVSMVWRPGPAHALQLARQGGLRCTFVFAASASALLRLYLDHAQDLVEQYSRGLRRSSRSREPLRSSGDPITGQVSCNDLLARAPDALRVLPGPWCGWTELSSPGRIERGPAVPQSGQRQPAMELVTVSP